MKKYIDLDKAVASLRDYFCDPSKSAWGKFEGPTITDICEEILGGLPSEDVRENIIGEWTQDNDFDIIDVYRCSRCSHMEFSPTYNFCPKCGASMRGDKD